MAERIRGLSAAPSLALELPQRPRHLITTGTRLRWSTLSPPPGVLGEAVEITAIDSRGRHRGVPAERFRYSAAGAASYALYVDADVVAYIIEGRRLDVPASLLRQ